MKRNLQNFKNCLGVYIPAEIRDDLNLKPGERVDFSVENGRIVMTPLHIVENTITSSKE